MSNKAKIDPIDSLIRKTAACGMTVGTVVRIEFISGFELFNTRPYHNYETWSQGYRVRGLGVRFEAEDLDDALAGWAKHVARKRDGGEIFPYLADDGHDLTNPDESGERLR